MLVVLGQRDDETLGCDTQATAATHLHIWTLKLRGHCAAALQHYNVETVAMAVTDQNVTRVARVDAIWIRCQRLIAKTTDEFPILGKHGDAVALKNHRIHINEIHPMCKRSISYTETVIQYHGDTAQVTSEATTT